MFNVKQLIQCKWRQLATDRFINRQLKSINTSNNKSMAFIPVIRYRLKLRAAIN